MKSTAYISIAVITALALMLTIENVTAQTNDTQKVSFTQRNLSGPRLGVTWVQPKSELAKRLKDEKIDVVISQFGWQFEYQVIPEGGGPSFVIQFVPLVGGVEYGTLVPSGSLAMGIRFPDGIEFGLGPNVIVGGSKGVNTSLIIAVGKSFNYGGVSIPLNFVLATSPVGIRASIIFGYAIAR